MAVPGAQADRRGGRDEDDRPRRDRDADDDDAPRRKKKALDEEPVKPDGDDRPSKLPPLAVSILSVGGGVLAYYAHGKALDYARLTRHAIDQDVYDTEAQHTRRWNGAVVVGISVASVSALAAGLLWYRALRTPTHVRVRADGDGADVSLGFDF